MKGSFLKMLYQFNKRSHYIILVISFIVIYLISSCTSSIVKESSTNIPGKELSIEFPKMTVGDEWRVDSLRGIVIRKVIKVESNGAFVLEEKSDNESNFFHLNYDNSYRLTARINQASGIYSKIAKPPFQYLSFPLFVGKKWQDNAYAQSVDGKYYNYQNYYSVEKIEMKTIEPGTFKAFKINLYSINSDTKKEFKEIYWYSPELKIIIKSESNWKKDTEVLAFKFGRNNSEDLNIKDINSNSNLVLISQKPSITNVNNANERDNTVRTHLMKGSDYFEKGQYDEAILEFNNAIETDPNYADAYLKRGKAYGYKELHDKAISDFSKAIQAKPDYAEGYLMRGRAYFITKKYDLAISDYTKAIEIKPNHYEAYDNRGYVYDINGQYDRAISDYSKAIEINSKSASTFNNRGVAYHRLGDKQNTCSDLITACKLGLCAEYQSAVEQGICAEEHKEIAEDFMIAQKNDSEAAYEFFIKKHQNLPKELPFLNAANLSIATLRLEATFKQIYESKRTNNMVLKDFFLAKEKESTYIVQKPRGTFFQDGKISMNIRTYSLFKPGLNQKGLNLSHFSTGHFLIFSGTNTIRGFTFFGDPLSPLVFGTCRDIGLVYLAGKGKIIRENGDELFFK
jgi:tetratricopeptide (TPR) repeat protein